MQSRSATRTTDPIEALTRRRLITAVPILTLMAAGLNCGDDDDPEPEATATTAAEWPRTVSHRLGETTIPAEPARVIAVNEGEALDHLLAVGIVPVLYGQTPGYDGEGRPSPWALEAGLDIDNGYEMARGEPDLERMAAAQPDLIVGAWIPQDQFDVMADIAPTIIIKDSDAIGWPEMQRMVGQATGREDAARQALDETDAAIKAGAERLEPYRGRNIMVGYNFFDELYIHGANTPIARLLAAMGMTIQAPDPDELTVFSLERIDELAPAEILLSPVFFPADQEKFESSPLTRGLPAVEAGNYMPLSLDIAQAGYAESTLSVRWVIPRLVDAVIEAGEGRGKQI